MTNNYIINKTFSRIDFTTNRLLIGEYDQCTFTNCTFAESEISNCVFLECEFISCNLSLTRVKNTAFQDVNFVDCKVLGIKFNECNDFLLTLNFKKCLLNLSSFYQLKLIGIIFDNCKLIEVDFSESNLTKAIFENCDLSDTMFDSTILVNSDFRTASNFTLDPDKNKLKNAKFSRNNIHGLLTKHQIIIE